MKKNGYIYPVMINTPQTKISLIILNLNISNDEDWYGDKGYSNFESHHSFKIQRINKRNEIKIKTEIKFKRTHRTRNSWTFLKRDAMFLFHI